MAPAARAWMIGAALLGALASGSVHAQGPVTERQAALYIYGGFLTDAAHAILSKDVRLGPELRRRLALPPDADSRMIYDELAALTDQKAMVVRKAGADELARYAPSARGELRQPLFALEVGDTTLLIQYDLLANNIPFIGQLAGPMDPVVVKKPAPPVVAEPPKPVAAPEPPKAVATPEPPATVVTPEPPKAVAIPLEPRKPVAAPEPPKPPAAAAPSPPAKPRAATVQAPKPRVQPLQPSGPCVVKPVMSNQDLVNCGATPP